jgi:hypothetical protein
VRTSAHLRASRAACSAAGGAPAPHNAVAPSGRAPSLHDLPKCVPLCTAPTHAPPTARPCRVLNEGGEPFDFTAALHSYFEVLGVDVAAVRGLSGLSYLDKSADPNNPAEKKEERDSVRRAARATSRRCSMRVLLRLRLRSELR